MYFIKICSMRKGILFVIIVCLLNACRPTADNSDIAIREQAQKFAEAYFAYDFIRAARFATPESEKWLRFAASNVTQEEIDLINATSKTADIEVTNCYPQNDSTTLVMMTVFNAILKDTLGHPAHMANEADFALTLVKRNGDYQVKMEGLPRNKR